MTPSLTTTLAAPAAVLPGSDLTAEALPVASPGSAITSTITPIPPVTFSTVMKPNRILWLIIIGLIVFVVSYGIQVVIWYRARR